MAAFRHLLVPVDLDEEAPPALDLALSIARTYEAQVTLVHAFDLSALLSTTSMYAALDAEAIQAALEKQLNDLCASTRAKWARIDAVLVVGRAAPAILDVAKARGCDLVVLGTHGRRGLSRLLLGSVAEKIVRLSPIPVLTVRPR